MNKQMVKMISNRKADLKWGQAIHSAGMCAVCGRTYGLEAHHIIHRNHKAVRHDVRNGCLLCWKHHRGKKSAHNTPAWFMAWLTANRPEQAEWVKANKWRIL